MQEALTNAARHAGAQCVSVVIEQHDAHVIAIVEDDGIGFDVRPVPFQAKSRRGVLGFRFRLVSFRSDRESQKDPRNRLR